MNVQGPLQDGEVPYLWKVEGVLELWEFERVLELLKGERVLNFWRWMSLDLSEKGEGLELLGAEDVIDGAVGAVSSHREGRDLEQE